ARYGGEEFAVILPNTSQEGAVSVAQRILTNLRHLAIPQIGSAIKSNTTNGLSISDVCLAGATDYVTMSLGLAVEIPQANFNLQFLIQEADKCLFKAKREGRDRLVSTSELSTVP
ncbi:MAG: diguanylate cyclase domain-containing protein, partial [Microcystaceae cyanobacterium]